MKTELVKKLATGVLLIVSLLISYTAMGAFNSTITVKVVDAETDEPIEGAVVLVQWTKTTGFGFKATSNFKVVELVSDENGELTIPGLFKFGVNKPKLVVYKKGYVAWDNEYIFPSYERRTDFRWRDGYVFELEKFKPEYSFLKHTSFLSSGYSTGVPSLGIFVSAWGWERKLAREERKKLRSTEVR